MINQTLNQRQKEYGDFQDVASLTENIASLLLNRQQEFNKSQRMAVYMIVSKLARLANGNPNLVDSWHDIAGYATLIENQLKS